MAVPMLRVQTVPSRGGAGALRVRAVGEVDCANASLLDRALTAAARRAPAALEVDLSEVTFFDGAAVRTLERAADAAQGRLRLVAASAPVHLVLCALGVQQRFTG
jgi:anti-anti-sigma factor